MTTYERNFYQFKAIWKKTDNNTKEKDDFIVHFYENDKPIFKLLRNTDFSSSVGFVIEFVLKPNCIVSQQEEKSGQLNKDKILFLFNLVHGVISVFDMYGKHLHDDLQDDKFVCEIKILGKYIIINAWYWFPNSVLFVGELNKLLTTPKYNYIFFLKPDHFNDTDLQYSLEGVSYKNRYISWEEIISGKCYFPQRFNFI